jgi:hypothetical protein
MSYQPKKPPVPKLPVIRQPRSSSYDAGGLRTTEAPQDCREWERMKALDEQRTT